MLPDARLSGLERFSLWAPLINLPVRDSGNGELNQRIPL